MRAECCVSVVRSRYWWEYWVPTKTNKSLIPKELKKRKSRCIELRHTVKNQYVVSLARTNKWWTTCRSKKHRAPLSWNQPRHRLMHARVRTGAKEARRHSEREFVWKSLAKATKIQRNPRNRKAIQRKIMDYEAKHRSIKSVKDNNYISFTHCATQYIDARRNQWPKQAHIKNKTDNKITTGVTL